MQTVFVVGSLNRDLTLSVPECPLPGETVLAHARTTGCGGKGANQAVAAARAGAPVVMVGCVGSDPEADDLLEALDAAGVDSSGVQRSADVSGLAVVVVAADGENQIVVEPGANSTVDETTVTRGLAALSAGDIVLAQAEIPVAAIIAAGQLAANRGARFVVNLSPLADVDLSSTGLTALVVNEHEAAALWGGLEPDPATLAAGLSARLRTDVVITLGGSGSLLCENGTVRRFHAYPPARVVDTTGAGDAFAGAFAAALAAGQDLDDAVRWGAAAGSLTVAAAGAQGAATTSPESIRAVIEAGHDL